MEETIKRESTCGFRMIKEIVEELSVDLARCDLAATERAARYYRELESQKLLLFLRSNDWQATHDILTRRIAEFEAEVPASEVLLESVMRAKDDEIAQLRDKIIRCGSRIAELEEVIDKAITLVYELQAS